METFIASFVCATLLLGAHPSPEASLPQDSEAPHQADADADGVPDRIDMCPGTADMSPVDGHGCALDGDGDGVHDGRDRCPATSGTFPIVDRHGCSVREIKRERAFRYPVALG